MKAVTIIALALLVTPAFAADKTPPAPTCGKTIEECQKQVDDLANRLAQTTLSFQAERQQRISNQTALGDQATQAFVAQQQAAAAPKK